MTAPYGLAFTVTEPGRRRRARHGRRMHASISRKAPVVLPIRALFPPAAVTLVERRCWRPGHRFILHRHGHIAYAHHMRGSSSTHACIDRCSEILRCQWDGVLGHCTQVANNSSLAMRPWSSPRTECSLFAWTQTSSTVQIAAISRTHEHMTCPALRRSPYRFNTGIRSSEQSFFSFFFLKRGLPSAF